MSQLNLNNLLMLYELRHQSSGSGVNAVTLDGENIAVVSGNSILPLTGKDTYELLGKILLNEKDITVVTYMQQSDSMFDYAADMNYVIPTYLASLPISNFSGLGMENIRLIYKRGLDYQECRIYLNTNEDRLGAFVYQWLDDYFAKNSLEISFPVLYSSMKENFSAEHGEEKLFLMVLSLAGLGFIRIIHKLSSGINSECSHMVALSDKVSLAYFIADNFKKKNYNILVRSRYIAFAYDFGSMDDMNIQKETSDEFFFNILTSQVNSGMMRSGEDNDRKEDLFSSLELFAQTKLLPIDIFTEEFEDNSVNYQYSLTDINYLNNLSQLIEAGIDILDMSVLSLAQTKKITISEIKGKTGFPLENINRSIFGLILLGLISVSQSSSAQTKHNTGSDSQSKRDNLRMVIEKAKMV